MVWRGGGGCAVGVGRTGGGERQPQEERSHVLLRFKPKPGRTSCDRPFLSSTAGSSKWQRSQQKAQRQQRARAGCGSAAFIPPRAGNLWRLLGSSDRAEASPSTQGLTLVHSAQAESCLVTAATCPHQASTSHLNLTRFYR